MPDPQSSLSHHSACVISLCALLGGDIDRALQLNSEHDLWSHLLQLAGEQLIVGQLADILLPSQGKLPDDIYDYLAANQLLNHDRNAAILKQIKTLTQALNQRDITPLWLKGAGLLLQDERYQCRMQSDIDLLVPPDKLTTAVHILTKLGFHFATPINTPTGVQLQVTDASQSRKQRRRYATHHHLPPLINGNAICSIELHKHIVRHRFQRHFPLEDVFDNAVLSRTEAGQYLTLQPNEQFRHWLYHDYVGTGLRARYQCPLRLYADWHLLGQPVLNNALFDEFTAIFALLNRLDINQPIAIPRVNTLAENHARQVLLHALNHPPTRRKAKRRHWLNKALNGISNPTKFLP